MRNLKKLEKRLLGMHKDDPAKLVLIRLVKSLCLKEDFNLSEIYELSYDDFELALDIMKDWRLDCYSKTRERILEIVTT
ncbi:hypothetical protein SCT_3020 [Sulfuricella sp. T08]|uniref:hypothetical protein n=1 Tax=Sulfuricella sp. T08 TaxID=1632857 RepID=UPI000617966C|nr:hypothetical protein [Sulfuricella sp. T08]GAO37584.1 hypothetical protein SCT_3020 [Sulfuricella sp. T08]